MLMITKQNDAQSVTFHLAGNSPGTERPCRIRFANGEVIETSVRSK